MKTKSNILTKAGVLLVAVFMVSSLIPVVTAVTSSDIVQPGDLLSLNSNDPNSHYRNFNFNEWNMESTGSLAGGGGFFADDWIQYDDGFTENGLGLTAGGDSTVALLLTDTELAGFRGDDIVEFEVAMGSDAYGAYPGINYEAWIETSQPGDPLSASIVGTGASTAVVWNNIDVTDYTIPASGDLWVGVNYLAYPSGTYIMGFDTHNTDYNGGHLWDLADGWINLNDIGFPGVWGFHVGVSSGGGPGPGPTEDCIENACDFAIDGFTDEFMAMSKGVDVDGDGSIDYYVWNSLDHDLCIKIANKGTIGIGELKLLAEVYEKICGPTITIFDNPKYDLQQFPCCGSDYPFEFPEDGHPDNPKVTGGWIVEDDNDQDSWALQGGPDNRWDTNNQAWRNTKGEDRSFGADEDVYLGKSDQAPPGAYDTLTTPMFDIAGAACASFTFSHWTEGEYTIDADGVLVPADYGTIAYSLDGGQTWIELSWSDFIAYDNDWEEVTLKFINTEIDANDLDYMHPYNMVCDDCMPEDDDIVIYGNLTAASLMVKFIWHKDPCLQFEGWYVDSFKVTRTEDYELELTCQTWDIIELDPCDIEVGVVWEDFCFPLDCEFDDDTWYEVRIYGQVFDPMGCEWDITNNEFKFQFKIQDIHDMACIDLYPTGDTTVQPGDSVSFNVTVQNVGTFAEDEVPVSLQAGKLVKEMVISDNFETDSLGDYTIYYFRFDECNSETPWRWSRGDTTIDKIYENDPAQARSRNPGSECLMFAEQGTNYPYLAEDACSVLAFPETLNLDPNKNWGAAGGPDAGDPYSAHLSFDMKYSLDVDGANIASYAMLGLMPTEGPASGYVLFIDTLIGSETYANDWQHFEDNDLATMFWNRIQGWNSDPTRDDYDYIPECELGILAWSEGDCVDFFSGVGGSGGCSNPDNEKPWTGFMFDGMYIDVLDADTDEFAKVYTGELIPGETETFNVAWTAELCSWLITAETQLPGDINPGNDQCCAFAAFVSEEERCFDGYVEDLTGGGECLWHVCTNREGGDDYFAWAGVETEHSAQYINNMDERLISPTIEIPSEFWDEGVLINWTTWYEFNSTTNDFGEFAIWRTFDHDDDPATANITNWDTIRKFVGNTDENFIQTGAYLPESYFPTDPAQKFNTKLSFRMYSDDHSVDEGWYIDDIVIFNVTDDNDTATFADTWYLYNAYSTSMSEGPCYMNEADPASLMLLAPTTSPDFLAGGTWFDDTWYGTMYGTGALYTIETDGTMNSIGGGGAGYNGLAEVGGQLYACSSTALYEVDDGDGSQTLVGNFGAGTLMIALASDGTTLWGINLDDMLYTVDTGSGAATLVGSLGIALNYAQDAEYDRGDGILYLSAYTTTGQLYTCDTGTGACTLIGNFNGGAEACAFAIPSAGGGGGGGGTLPDGAIVGECLPCFTWDNYEIDCTIYPGDPCSSPYCSETFERGDIAPWICEPSIGGQYWFHTDDEDTIPSDAGIPEDHDPCDECDERPWVIPSVNLVPWGYNGEGTGLDDAMAIEVDLTDPTLDSSYMLFDCLMNYNLSKENLFIEISPDWEPGTPMESATWVQYWVHTPGDSYGDNTEGWVALSDITGPIDDDDRWNLDEYAGSVIYIRFRLTHPGNGAGIGEGWAIADLHIGVKHTGTGFVDTEPPVTSIFFNEQTGKVTLIAQDYPLTKGTGIAGTYYIIDGGAQQTYGSPFTLDEGTHTVQYWSEDHAGNVENKKSSTFVVDTTPPTVELVSPEEGGIYFLGNKVLTLGSKTICIGKVPVEAEASDAGSGVSKVLFSFDNGDSGFDTTAPYEYTFRAMHFGSLTITAVAEDNNGLQSSPDEMTITVFSLGLL